MSRLARIQRLSAAFRYLLIAGSIALGAAIVIAMFTQDQGWISIGDGQLDELRDSAAGNKLALLAIMAPLAITVLLGVYWLQRLFAEYQAGRFFTDGSMRCYVWLVWLKAASFLYGAIWPQLLNGLSSAPGAAHLPVSLDAGTLVELLVLLVIVHVLKEAQRLSDENQAFV